MSKFIVSSLLLAVIMITPQIKLPYVITIDSITKPVTAREPEIPPFETDAKALAAYTADDAAPVITYEDDTVWPIASLTKMMSAIVFFEQNPNLQQPVTLEKEDMVGGAMVKVPVGTQFSADDLIHATLMVSANNAAHALHKATPLSQDAFVAKMNERAESLGLEKTSFTDPTGLNPHNLSTPEEYAKVMKAAMEIPQISKIMGKASYTMHPVGKKSFQIGTTNQFLNRDTETSFTVMGAKTGLLNESGFNLAVTAKRDDTEMTAIIFGEASFDKAFKDARQLLEQAFEKTEKAE